VVVKQLDLADLQSVRRLSDELQKEDRIDMLICNAGVSNSILSAHLRHIIASAHCQTEAARISHGVCLCLCVCVCVKR
jgi:short-subunit dehydrogenase